MAAINPQARQQPVPTAVFDADTGAQLPAGAYQPLPAVPMSQAEQFFSGQVQVFQGALRTAQAVSNTARSVGINVHIGEREIGIAAAGFGAWLIYRALKKGL